jgi:hypothetical protein
MYGFTVFIFYVNVCISLTNIIFRVFGNRVLEEYLDFRERERDRKGIGDK